MYTSAMIVASVVGTLLVVLLVRNLAAAGGKIAYQIEASYGVGDDQFVRSMGSLLGPPFAGGNRLAAFQNGDEIFPAMLDAIRGARQTITFETFVYWSGEIGRRFADALADRARAGVKVHVILDGFGAASIESQSLDMLREAGVQVAWYNPVCWYTLSRLNNRTHRKLLVVDGRVGFTGGVGIADKWLGDGGSPDDWRDSHYRIEGPAVAQVQAAFTDNWSKTREEVLHSDEYFPPLPEAGSSRVQVFKSSPREGSESVRLMYLLSLASARERVRLATAYFVPDDLAIRELLAARRRGVRIEIVVPGPHMDKQLVRRASRARWGELLRAGCEISEFLPTMYHCKVMIVDDLWVSVGSTNFDNRSFRLNDEANMNVLDADFAREQVAVFERDRKLSRRVTLEEWENRPWSEKLLDRLAGLFGSQL